MPAPRERSRSREVGPTAAAIAFAVLATLAALLTGARPAHAEPPAPMRQESTAALQFGALPFRFPPRPADLEAAMEGERRDEGDRGEANGAVSGTGNDEGERPTPAQAAGLGAAPTFPRGARALRRTPAALAAVTVSTTFDGPTLNDSNAFPPDSMGDVGPTQFLVGVNGRLRSYDKATGAADGGIDMDFDTFWTLASPTFSSDPRVRYDRRAGRWVIVMIDVPGGTIASQNNVHIAVSDGPTISPSTVWTFHSFLSDAGEFLDYPTLGVDGDALYIGGLAFSTSTLSAVASRAYVVQKSSAYGAGGLVVTRFATATGSGSGAFLPQGVDARDDSGNGHGYFIGVDNAMFSRLDVVRIDNPGSASPTVGATTQIVVPATSFPTPVPHLGNTGGTAGRLDAIDDRLYNATLRGGHLYAAHAIGIDATGAVSAGADRDGARWYDVDVSGAAPALGQAGTVFDAAASNPRSFWFPSVGVNGQGTLAIGGSVAGALSAANAWTASRAVGDPAGQVATPTTFTSSTAAYNPPGDNGSGHGARRWGDYSFTGVDPDDDQTLWTIQEYTASADTWGVRVAKLLARPPATPDPATATLGQVTTTVGIDGHGGTWFDPGPGFPQRLALSVGCGVVVRSVSVPSPAHLQAVLDTSAVTTPQTCDVTVTDPDGQATVGAGALALVVGAPPSPPPNTTTPGPAPTVTTGVPTTPGPTTTPSATTPVAPIATQLRCVVPRLRGRTLNGARRLLARAHCRLGTVRRVAGRGVKRRRVLSSSPAGGRRLAAGSAVAVRLRR